MTMPYESAVPCLPLLLSSRFGRDELRRFGTGDCRVLDGDGRSFDAIAQQRRQEAA